jgi:predicted alpha/beta-fold hydrolase
MDGQRAAASFPAFVPRPPWLTADLQTLRNFLRRTWYDLAPWPETRLELAMADGDRLLGHLHTPERARATVVLIHGLTGCADSTYVRATAHHLLSAGYAVLRLNLRGAGPARPLCRLQYHAGRSDDLRQALRAFAVRRPDLAGGPLFAVGYSLGGNMLLKYLGEEGRAAPLQAAVAVSAPIDLRAASLCLMASRNRFYHGYLIGRMRAEALAPSAALSAGERRAILTARTVYEYDDRFVAPRNGFADAEDYYRRSSAAGYLGAIATPTMIIHALDDPWVPAASYRSVEWRGQPALTPLLAPRGGHVGFHGVGSRVPWHDRCAKLFLDNRC